MGSGSNVWRTIALILLGIVLGYAIGRFELTTITFDNELKDSKDSKTEVQQDDEDKEEAQQPSQPVTPTVQEIDLEDDPFLGDANASLVIVDFSDYQCPFCKKLYTDVFPQLKEDFIDTGKAKYVFKDFPLNIHPPAVFAHMAAECAGDQGKYWEMHALLFDKQSEWSKAEDVNATLIGYSTELGLNQALLSECLTSEKYREEVESDRDDAIGYGARGTPTLFINGKILRGLPQNYEQFKQLLENEL
jgi:protein-disulfide isomerase